MLLMASRENVADTKKAHLDSFFDHHRESACADLEQLKTGVETVLNAMAAIFVDADALLRSVGMVSLYFLLFEAAVAKGIGNRIARAQLLAFEDLRQRNRRTAEDDIASANYNLLEFDRFAQSPNDGIAMRFRLAVLDQHLFQGELGFAEEKVLPNDIG
jgi:hypothetical protein